MNTFNESFTGKLEKETVSLFLKDKSGSIVGGILGEIEWGWLYVEGLWVDDRLRYDGWGGLLHTLGHYALSKSVTNCRLETTSFQALGFYEKMGYTVFGELPDMPPGHISYF